MRHAVAAALLSLVLGACASSRQSACESYFPSCDRGAERPSCETLTWPSGQPLDRDRLVGQVTEDYVASFFGPEVTPDSFSVRAAGADSFWYYDGSGRMDGGMMIGSEELVAIRGCDVIATFTLVIYN